MLSVADAQAIIDGSDFGAWWGYEVRDVGEGTATLSLRARPELYRPGGVLHGGSLMSLADVAFWIAAITRIGRDMRAVTLEEKTNFLRGAVGDLVCKADVMKVGRRVVYGTATTTDTAGRLVAHSTLTYLRAPDETSLTATP